VSCTNNSSAVAEMGDRGHNTHGPKRGGLLCPVRAELGPRLIQCGLGRDLLPYQVVCSSIHPFGHNRHEPKTGGAVPLFGGAATPSNTTSPAPRFTSVPRGILIHPAVWPQRTLVENCLLFHFSGGQLGPHLTQCRVGRGVTPYQVTS